MRVLTTLGPSCMLIVRFALISCVGNAPQMQHLADMGDQMGETNTRTLQ